MLTEALADPHVKASIEAIDDLWVSLDHGDRREPTLERLLASEVFILRTRGVEYDPRKMFQFPPR